MVRPIRSRRGARVEAHGSSVQTQRIHRYTADTLATPLGSRTARRHATIPAQSIPLHSIAHGQCICVSVCVCVCVCVCVVRLHEHCLQERR